MVDDKWYAEHVALLRKIGGYLTHLRKRRDNDVVSQAEWRLTFTGKGAWQTWQGVFDADTALIERLLHEILRMKSRERDRFTRAMELKHSAINAEVMLYDILKSGECSDELCGRIQAVLKENMT